MTLAGKVQAPSSNNWQYLYYLLNPAGDQQRCCSAASSHYLISQAASWYNVRQTGQPDAFTTNTLAATNTSVTTSLKLSPQDRWCCKESGLSDISPRERVRFL